MVVVRPIRLRDQAFVESVVARLVTTEEYNRDAARIEGVEDAERPPVVLNAQLAQMRVPRPVDTGLVREPQARPVLDEQVDPGRDGLAFVIAQRGEPRAEFVGPFDVPVHALNICRL